MTSLRGVASSPGDLRALRTFRDGWCRPSRTRRGFSMLLDPEPWVGAASPPYRDAAGAAMRAMTASEFDARAESWRLRAVSGELDAEIRALGPWDASTMTDDDAAELGDVLDFFADEIPTGRNFEFLNALLAHFLRVHGGALQARESLRMKAERVRERAKATWRGVDDLLQEVRCALGFFGGVAGS